MAFKEQLDEKRQRVTAIPMETNPQCYFSYGKEMKRNFRQVKTILQIPVESLTPKYCVPNGVNFYNCR
jgi:hypothetical protein